MSLSTGQILENRYRIAAPLGQGGMGAVYQATDLRFNATVAIKENRMVTDESQKQFAREAGLLYRLRHPNLPRVIDHFSIPNQGQYLVMDYVEGQDLKQIVARYGPVPQAQALKWMGEVLEALEYLHNVNIIHRDIKPANVKITPQGDVFLVDFGLAKVFDPSQQTTLGARGVTPGYAPPEQYGQGRTDARSDIYSAAATLYALITGHNPPDALEYMTRQVQFLPPRQLNPQISPQVEAAILRAMETAPDDRFQTVADLRTALFEPPTRQVGKEAMATPVPRAVAPAPKVATPSPRTPASAPRPAPSPAQPVAKTPSRRRRPAQEERVGRISARPIPRIEPPSPPINWKRVGRFVLLAAFLGTVSAVLDGGSAALPLGHLGVGLVVLGLLVYHARHTLQFRKRQYQLEVLGMWLSVTIAYLLILAVVYDAYLDPEAVFLGTLVVFWLPSALVGALILWLARRRALGKQRLTMQPPTEHKGSNAP